MTPGPDARRAFAILFAVMMVMAAGNNALQSVLPSIGRELGAPDLGVALVFSVSALLWTVAAPFWARQADLRGRKRLVELGLAGFAVSTLASGLVILLGLTGWLAPLAAIALFALTRSLFGLFGSAAPGAAQAYVAARTLPAQRTQALATLSSAFGLGTVLGPALAPFLILPFLGLSGPLFGFGLIALVLLLAVRRELPGDAPDPAQAAAPRRRLDWRDSRVAPFLIYGLAAGTAQAIASQVFGFFLIDLMKLPPEQAQAFIGVAMMAGAAATLIAQWGLVRLFSMSPRQLLRWGAGLGAAGLLMLAAAGTYGTAVTGFALMSLGFGFARPGFAAGASLAVGPEDQGAVAGAVTAINGACFIYAPAIGVLVYHAAPHAPFLLAAAITAGMGLYCFSNLALSRATPTAEPPPALD